MDEMKTTTEWVLDEMPSVTFGGVLAIHFMGLAVLYTFPTFPPKMEPLREIIQFFCMSTLIVGGVLMALMTAVRMAMLPLKRDETMLHLGSSLIVLSILGYSAFSHFPLMETAMYFLGGIGAASLAIGIALLWRTMNKTPA